MTPSPNVDVAEQAKRSVVRGTVSHRRTRRSPTRRPGAPATRSCPGRSGARGTRARWPRPPGTLPSAYPSDGIGATQVRRLRIVAPRADPVRLQMLGQPRRDPPSGRRRGATRASFPPATGGSTRSPTSSRAVEVHGGDRTPLVVPAVEQRELPRQHGRLDRVEPRRPADLVVVVLPVLTVLTQRPDARRRASGRRHERAGVAHRTEVLAGIEAERRRVTRRACPPAVALAPCA